MADMFTALKIRRHIGRLGDDNPARRQAAMAALQAIGSPAIAPLCAALQDGDPLRGAGAATVLGALRDPRGVEPLLAALSREQALEAVIGALGDIGHPAAVRALVALFQPRYLHLTEQTAQALVKIGTPARETLIAVLSDRNQADMARYWAAVVLARLGWQPQKDALGIAYWVQMQDWDKCGQMGPQAFDPLEAELRAGIPPGARQNIAGVLARLGGPRAVESLTGLLHDGDSGVRRTAVGALATLGGPRAVEAMAVALQDGDGDVRRTAVQSLIKSGDPRTVELLQGALHDNDSSVRLATVEVLTKVSDPRALDGLASAVKDNDTAVRRAAVDALCESTDPRAVAALAPAVKDNDAAVRRAAVGALSKSADPRALAALAAAVKDGDVAVRRAAVEALAKSADPQALAGLAAAVKDKDQTVRRAAVTALSRRKEPAAVEALAPAVKDGDAAVRQLALDVLSKSGHPRAAEMVGAALKGGDGAVAQAAMAALLKLEDPQALAPIEAMLRDSKESVRRSTAELLGKTGAARAASLLVPLLSDRDSGVRQAASNALAALKWRPTHDAAGAAYCIARGAYNDLIPMGAVAVEPLIAELKRLGTGYAWKSERKTVVTVLGKLGDRRAIPALEAAVRSDISSGVTSRARRSLGWLKA